MLARYCQLALFLAVSSVRGQTYAQSQHADPTDKRLTISRRREHVVPGLAFRLTSPDLLAEADLDCSDGNSLSRFTAGVEIKANYTEACYNIATSSTGATRIRPPDGSTAPATGTATPVQTNGGISITPILTRTRRIPSLPRASREMA